MGVNFYSKEIKVVLDSNDTKYWGFGAETLRDGQEDACVMSLSSFVLAN